MVHVRGGGILLASTHVIAFLSAFFRIERYRQTPVAPALPPLPARNGMRYGGVLLANMHVIPFASSFFKSKNIFVLSRDQSVLR